MYRKTNRFVLAAAYFTVFSCLMVAASEPARADVMQYFTLNGTFQYAPPVGETFPFSAQVAIDTTTGTITSASLSPNDPRSPTVFTQGYNAMAQAYLLKIDVSLTPVEFQIFFDAASLVDYAGGNLGSLANPTLGGAASRYITTLIPPTFLVSGSASVAVPEPASGGLLAIAAAAVAVLLATRRRNQGGQRGEVWLPAPSHPLPAAALG